MAATTAAAPPPVIPEDAALGIAAVELGRQLFYDRRLSRTGAYACASCHQPARAFTDGRRVAIGADGDKHLRNTPSLANVVYRPVLAWAEPRLTRLEEQLLTPLLGTHPVELGASEGSVLATISADPVYRRLFAEAFGGTMSLANAAKAVAAFERTLVSFSSAWDRDALSPAAWRGAALFFSERTNCFQCHPAPHFTDTSLSADRPFAEIGFHNIGLYDVDGQGAYPVGNRGLYEHTQRPGDMGRFRAPSLRNVAITAPYMHDGSIATLAEVIAHYAAGGLGNPYKSAYLTGFEISAQEALDLITFLKSLTDESFLSDPKLGDPFAANP